MKGYLSTFTVLLCSTLLLVNAQNNCPLPTNTEIEGELVPLLVRADGSATYNPNITRPVHYVCQSQGDFRDTYRTVSIIATFTRNPGENEQTRIFQLECNNGPAWSAVTNGGLLTPPASVINGTTRTDCALCDPLFGDDRCDDCNAMCASGLGRCVGTRTACCSVFLSNSVPPGRCSTDCSSDGNNYVATMDNGFVCMCSFTCPSGYTVNSTCNGCDFTDICLRDRPCQNGGNCTLLSAPDNYTCNCDGTGYEGDNCTDLIPSPSPSPSPVVPSPSPSCTLSGCDTCDTPSCCATCNTGYSLVSGGCTCVVSSSVAMPLPSCAVSGCRMCSMARFDCCATCLPGYVDDGPCNCLVSPTSSPEMSSSIVPTPTATSPPREGGIPAGTLIGAIIGAILGVLLILTLVAVIAYLIYYFVAGAGSATTKAKSKSPFANGESHNNPLYLAPDEVEGSNL